MTKAPKDAAKLHGGLHLYVITRVQGVAHASCIAHRRNISETCCKTKAVPGPIGPMRVHVPMRRDQIGTGDDSSLLGSAAIKTVDSAYGIV